MRLVAAWHLDTKPDGQFTAAGGRRLTCEPEIVCVTRAEAQEGTER